MILSKEEKHVTEISANYFDEKFTKNHVTNNLFQTKLLEVGVSASSSDIKKTLPEFEISNTSTLSNLDTVPEESTEIQASVFYEDVNDNEDNYRNFSDDGSFCVIGMYDTHHLRSPGPRYANPRHTYSVSQSEDAIASNYTTFMWKSK
ncbi:736_t:CDS:2 [Ambispora leptoticha]|uniref:736_t:CDS:1 n=1 Tax=Ambispora leptoticha TaxID=144679 RepID=A0A9N9BD29_9GLOM|nr:736_t:CDS:2 [Ambispora leptoticha]